MGSLRPFKFAIHLRKYGYQPVILTIAASGSSFTDLEGELLRDIPIIEIEPPFDKTTQKKQEESLDESGSPVLDWFDKNTPIDSWIYLFVLKYRSISKKIRELNPDIIWATGDPWSGLWLGEKLSRELSKPFVADFRDPWTLSDVNLRRRSSFSESVDKNVEKKVVQKADRIIFTSKTSEKRYQNHYDLADAKTRTIYNSFDKTLTRAFKDQTWETKFNPEYLNLIFFGKFRRLSPVTPVAEGLKVLKKSNPEEASCIRIHSFGKPDSENISLITEYGLEENFINHEQVVPEKMLPVLTNADILLLSTNMHRHQVIPAKLWDYLSVDIPIFSITPNEEVGNIIMKSKAGIQVHPNKKEEIAELLQSFARAKRNEESVLLLPEKDIPNRDMYDAKHTSGELAAVFDELLKDG